MRFPKKLKPVKSKKKKVLKYTREQKLGILEEYLCSSECTIPYFCRYINNTIPLGSIYNFIYYAKDVDPTLYEDVVAKMERNNASQIGKKQCNKAIDSVNHDMDFSELKGKTISRGAIIDWFLKNKYDARYVKLTVRQLIDIAEDNGVKVLRDI